MENKKLYFVSDLHLGINPESSRIQRERLFVEWLDMIKADAAGIYLLGDIFDIWYEFSKVAPKGYIRTLGKIAELTDSGIPVHFFRGNHDGWFYEYLCQETGMVPHSKEETVSFNGKTLIVGHGDGVGDNEGAFNLMKWFLNSGLAKFILRYAFKPAWSLGLCEAVSRRNRLAKGLTIPFLGAGNESQVQYCNRILKCGGKVDYFVLGHRHLAIDMKLSETSRYICLGEWVKACTYAVLDEDGSMTLKSFTGRDDLISIF